MPAKAVSPLTHPVPVDRLPALGTEVTVEASEAERAALAQDFGIPAIKVLTGRFRVKALPGGQGVKVTGRVRGEVTQICVVTLDPFDGALDEEVDVDFVPAGDPRRRPDPAPDDEEQDAPDEIVDGRIDLGALTAEFLALGLDPYPRKPGVDFVQEAGPALESPFAALAKLKGEGS
ncbi:MAG TPA: DUF177 domain-containing protein [Beijerinckiaceae bacterium]|jgi:uncharacterized metal-binding protein YceD (DUF177 family)